MKYAEDHPIPIDMALGEGHKFLIITTSSPTNVYLSSVPGVSSDMYSQFTEDNFFYTVVEAGLNVIFGTNSSYSEGRMAPGNFGYYPPSFSYDGSTGCLTVTPAKVLANGQFGGHGEGYSATSFYFVK